jgi:hypothetical protein
MVLVMDLLMVVVLVLLMAGMLAPGSVLQMVLELVYLVDMLVPMKA